MTSNIDVNDDHYDLIAPGTQNVEQQDGSEAAQEFHPELNANYGLAADLGVASAALNNGQLVLLEEPDDGYRVLSHPTSHQNY